MLHRRSRRPDTGRRDHGKAVEAAVIDLSRVTFIDSAVLTELVASRRRGDDGQGARLALVAPPGGFPARVLGLLQLGRVIGVYASRDEALASF